MDGCPSEKKQSACCCCWRQEREITKWLARPPHPYSPLTQQVVRPLYRQTRQTKDGDPAAAALSLFLWRLLNAGKERKKKAVSRCRRWMIHSGRLMCSNATVLLMKGSDSSPAICYVGTRAHRFAHFGLPSVSSLLNLSSVAATDGHQREEIRKMPVADTRRQGAAREKTPKNKSVRGATE